LAWAIQSGEFSRPLRQAGSLAAGIHAAGNVDANVADGANGPYDSNDPNATDDADDAVHAPYSGWRMVRP